MEVFIRRVPQYASDQDLTNFFKPYMPGFGIEVFQCEKLKNKPFAILTIADVRAGTNFLRTYGSDHPLNGSLQLKFLGHSLLLTQSKNKPDQFKIKSMVQTHQKKTQKGQQTTHAKAPLNQFQNNFEFRTLFNGFWTYHDGHLLFNPCYAHQNPGMVLFGRNSLSFFLYASAGGTCFRMDVPYYTVETVLTGSRKQPSVSFDLNSAPKIYLLPEDNFRVPANATKTRISGLAARHAECSGSCFSYQIMLHNGRDLDTLKMTLSRSGMPPSIPYATSYQSTGGFVREFHRFDQDMNNAEVTGKLPFEILFQAHKLVTNGILPPSKVSALFNTMAHAKTQYGVDAVVYSLRRLSINLPFPGPQVAPDTFDLSQLTKMINRYARDFRFEGSIYQLVQRHEHLVLTYRALVTPTGVYLEGPEPEVTNRVLRKYSGYTTHFVRVTFADETKEALLFDARTNMNEIFNRFQKAMATGIKIATRNYLFLGYSHSSLRGQSCWFMAPFVQEGQLIYAKEIIKGLGDFSRITSPARSAARIGQAFTDTTGAIAVSPKSVIRIPDVERNGRCFSDGCGKISVDLLRKVWREYKFGLTKGPRPTTLQIRFSGAKGVVSLDPTLSGEQLCLRPSMIKFESEDRNLEICGAAFRALPCYLNRQFIKILEDLQVPADVFLNLQAEAIDHLRKITMNPLNASKFLEHSGQIGGNAQTPALIKMLHYIDLSFLEDPFLREVVEYAALHHLRELKYRGRIPIEDGCTLFGVMDETGILQEHEAHVILETKDGGRRILTGKVVVTRAPAYHPGDIQVLTAVDVPEDSPLNFLRNCIVFSKHGTRDLPSCLSGGDLDGDLYQVIFDPRLFPKVLYLPAENPRVTPADIGRVVETTDMIDFFITFLKNDQLGRIASIHVQLADRKALGTADPDCLTLAELASTAVDFSKTGIPVDLSRMPKYDRIRPDFMAPGPKALIGAKGPMIEESDDDESDKEDPTAAFEPVFKRYRYYESEKVLGKLFRAIDERKFFESMQKQINDEVRTRPVGQGSVMERLWDYVEKETTGFQWRHHLDDARELRRNYEDNLMDIIYSTDLRDPLNEVEVFCGIILGRSSQSKRQREQQKELKEQYDELVASVTLRIKDVESDELLSRSMACLYLGIFEAKRMGRNKIHLRSFKYVAAAIVLDEVRKLQGGLLGLSKWNFGRLSLN